MGRPRPGRELTPRSWGRWGRRQALSDEDEFAGSLRVACDRLGLSVISLTSDTVEVRGRRLTGTVAVADLRARCALLPTQQWEGELLAAMEALALSRESVEGLEDLASAGPLLRTRVLAEGAVLADDVVARPLCPGLVEVLVVAQHGTLGQVPGRVATGWDVPAEELLARGRRQVLAEDRVDSAPLDLGVEVVALQTESAFAAVHLDRLPALVDVPEAGALVALPTRHLVLVAPLRTRAAGLEAAQALLLNAEALWQAGPGALSPDLFWWRDGRLVHLPGSPTSLSPPQEFLDVLDALPPG